MCIMNINILPCHMPFNNNIKKVNEQINKTDTFPKTTQVN